MSESLRYIQAVNAALAWSLESRSDTVYFGEDVALPGGPFGATKGLHKRFGSDRIFDTPISETGFLGMALGAAMTGLRPIAEIMYADFSFVAMDQIVNQIATIRYSSAGRWKAPLVIRMQQGYSPGACAQHSHSVEAYFAHTPGLRVALPSTPDDAYQMLRTAVVSDDPVVVAEARMLYPTRGPVRTDAPVEPIGGARVVRDGRDATVVAWSRMVPAALAAADQLAAEGIETEVIDLRWLNPLDFDTVGASVARTGRLVVAHEANLTGGFGAEIAARAASECFADLRAPVARVAAPDVPMPAAPALQKAVVPEAEHVAEAVRGTVRR
ncbi:MULTISPECIES: alpha-ketoacid dehydrogenase subunit beta [unclassified Micromonospora]|uniref:alpha-ketoacid dehydrogenase subunit beta n=1 Tax=unclassified Micromonospora TaxID=2617518 RepID=UPI0010349304|nr:MULTISPECIES: transketolase C-terminal domain-containing protein [unclassified Micromonospora]QKW13862.1 acetoin dehydrogenase [Verrucosispora sp. NA02020]TBL23856.1 acetoin dehydrogenase [Verrucosispora sp. SN26_14.1]